MYEYALQILDKIKNTPVEIDPFPHFIIQEFLPKDLHIEALKNYPDDIIELGQTSSKHRKILENNSLYFKKALEKNLILKHIYNISRKKIFQNIILDKFNSFINENLFDYNLNSQLDITKATAGYQRSVHLDRPKHIVSSMWYLNDNYDFNGVGGDLLLHSYNNSDKIYDVFPEDCVAPVQKQVEIQANMYICWLACPWAYHSIIPLSKADGYRKFIYIAINDADECIWNNYNIKILSESRRNIFINQ